MGLFALIHCRGGVVQSASRGKFTTAVKNIGTDIKKHSGLYAFFHRCFWIYAIHIADKTAYDQPGVKSHLVVLASCLILCNSENKEHAQALVKFMQESVGLADAYEKMKSLGKTAAEIVKRQEVLPLAVELASLRAIA